MMRRFLQLRSRELAGDYIIPVLLACVNVASRNHQPAEVLLLRVGQLVLRLSKAEPQRKRFHETFEVGISQPNQLKV